MELIRAWWRLIVMVVAFLGIAAIGVSFAVTKSRDSTPVVLPYDPMPRW